MRKAYAHQEAIIKDDPEKTGLISCQRGILFVCALINVFAVALDAIRTVSRRLCFINAGGTFAHAARLNGIRTMLGMGVVVSNLSGRPLLISNMICTRLIVDTWQSMVRKIPLSTEKIQLKVILKRIVGGRPLMSSLLTKAQVAFLPSEVSLKITLNGRKKLAVLDRLFVIGSFRDLIPN